MRASWRVRGGAALCVVGVIGCGGGAELIGSRAKRGAIEEARAQAQQLDPSQPSALVERSARGAVKGALSQLDTPEQREQLASALRLAFASGVRGGMEGALVTSTEQADALAGLAARLTRGSMDAIAHALGPNGYGPLARRLSATTEQLSASAVRGARQEVGGLFPECDGPDREGCVERRLTDLSRAVSSGVAAGLRELLTLPLLLFGFLCGIAVAMAIGWIRSTRS